LEDPLREHADHHDAELLLKLYDLRREEKLRKAREWYMREFHADSADDLYKRFPQGSEENTFFRMVVSYWDMAASLVNHGLINEEFFFENTTEFWLVWIKLKPLVPELRERRKNQYAWNNLETLVDIYEKWMKKRAPQALETLRQQVLAAKPKA
jgi:hypothetical protein